MGWSEAYNFNIDESISISKAISLREKKDPRAGDLHCHKSCYLSKEGSRLLTRKASIDNKTGKVKKKAHFAKWPSKYEDTGLFCGFATIADSKRESMDYSMYFHKFDDYLRSLTQNIEPYFIESVSKNDGQFEPDFEISHSQKIRGEISLTDIHIIDENKRKKKIYPKSYIDGNKFVISIRISEYTTKQLLDFNKGGIEKLNIEWNYLVNQLDEKIENIVKMNNDDENLLQQMITVIDEVKMLRKEIISDAWNKITHEIIVKTITNDNHKSLSEKERKLYSFLEELKLIKYFDKKRYNNPEWTNENLEDKLAIAIEDIDPKSFHRIENSKRFKEITSYGIWHRWNEGTKVLVLGAFIENEKREMREIYYRVNKKKKEVWKAEFPEAFEKKKSLITEKENQISIIRRKLKQQSEEMAKKGIFENPNDPKVIEMLEIIGNLVSQKDIDVLMDEISEIKLDIF